MEPFLEGEEIAEAIASEIRAVIAASERGETQSDLKAGKVIEKEDRLLVSAKALSEVVRRRLVDEVVSQRTIAEAAAAVLGMWKTRPDFDGKRLRAWAFPLRLSSVDEVDPLDAAMDREENDASPVDADSSGWIQGSSKNGHRWISK
jgi:hypothetical protein